MTDYNTNAKRSAKEIRADIYQMIEQIEDGEKRQYPTPDLITARILEELDGYNGCLADDRIYPMEMLTEFYRHDDEGMWSLIWGIRCGYDEGNRNADTPREDFNPNAPFFYFNGYANPVSVWIKRYDLDADDVATSGYLDELTALDEEPELKALFKELAEALNA